jgi:hypothetical protein
MGAVGIHPMRSITHNNTDRKEVLQKGSLSVMRAMRSVLCDAY